MFETSNRLKVCLVLNGAPHYRASIFRLIDDTFDCEWFFARGKDGIKQLPLSFFKHSHYLDSKRLWKALCCQPGEARVLLSKKYDVFLILGEIVNVSCWWGMFLHNIFNHRHKVYYWSHGVLGMHNQPRRFFDKLFFSFPFASFVYGNRSRENLIKLGIDSSKLFVIHNSIDYEQQVSFLSKLQPSDIYSSHFYNTDPVIVFIGRLIKDKQLGMVLDAASIAINTNRPFNIVFIGEGEDKLLLQQKTEYYHLRERVWFYGACYDETVLSRLLYNADICVSPGPIGLTAIHAMTYGCPVITHDDFDHHGPEHEAIIKGVTGDFFEYGNVYSLAAVINEWLDNHLDDRETVRENCYLEIGSKWTAQYQIEVLKNHLKA